MKVNNYVDENKNDSKFNLNENKGEVKSNFRETENLDVIHEINENSKREQDAYLHQEKIEIDLNPAINKI